MSEGKNKGQIAKDWWAQALSNRDSGAARGLAARLRRAEGVAVLAEPDVQVLARRLGLGPAQADVIVRLAQVLAEVRDSGNATLAQRLGGREPVLSNLRFQRLMRTSSDELAQRLRRAVIMADRRCSVARLAEDLLAWDDPEAGDRIRAKWCFDYFGDFREASESPSKENAE